MAFKEWKSYRTHNGQDQERNCQYHTIIKTQNVQNEDNILHAVKEKDQGT